MRIEKAYLNEQEVFIMNNIEVLPNKHIIGDVTIHYKGGSSDTTYNKFRITDENGKSFENNKIRDIRKKNLCKEKNYIWREI